MDISKCLYLVSKILKNFFIYIIELLKCLFESMYMFCPKVGTYFLSDFKLRKHPQYHPHHISGVHLRPLLCIFLLAQSQFRLDSYGSQVVRQVGDAHSPHKYNQLLILFLLRIENLQTLLTILQIEIEINSLNEIYLFALYTLFKSMSEGINKEMYLT